MGLSIRNQKYTHPKLVCALLRKERGKRPRAECLDPTKKLENRFYSLTLQSECSQDLDIIKKLGYIVTGCSSCWEYKVGSVKGTLRAPSPSPDG